jgi:putative PIN family toxin of toxin-antitoxin system
MRAVVDTNILVRALIKPNGTVGSVLSLLRDGRYVLLYSEQLLEEMVDVLARPRLRNKYPLSDETVEALLQLILLRGRKVRPQREIRRCRDPKDNMFLEVAAAGHAEIIVSGDEDLLILNPFEDIPIVPPRDFLARLASSNS